MTTKKTKTMKTTIDDLVAAAEQCLAELRGLGHSKKARRAVVQARYRALPSPVANPHFSAPQRQVYYQGPARLEGDLQSMRPHVMLTWITKQDRGVAGRHAGLRGGAAQFATFVKQEHET